MKIPHDQADALREIMKRTGEHPPKCLCCVGASRKASGVTIGSTSRRAFNLLWNNKYKSAASGGASSKAARTYTPVASSSSTTPTPGGTDSNSGVIDNAGNINIPQTQAYHATSGSTTPPTASKRVIFGVQGVRRSLEIEQLSIMDDTNDQMFFSQLKTQYKKHRSYFGRFLSPFRFRHCNFVKVGLLKPSYQA